MPGQRTFTDEYYKERWPGNQPPHQLGARVLSRPGAIAEYIGNLPASVRRGAFRSMRGKILRTELYALDGTPRQSMPYTVTEHLYGVREESPPATTDPPNRLRIFFAFALSERTTQWERGNDPLSVFTFTDNCTLAGQTSDYDAYGQLLSQISVAVPRGRVFQSSASSGEPYLATQTVTSYAQPGDIQANYIVDRVCSTTVYEISKDGRQFTLPAGNNRLTLLTIGSSTNYKYAYDASGNLIQENTERHFEWDANGRLRVFRIQPDNAPPSKYAQYLYDSAGERVMKLVLDQSGGHETTIYIDGIFEYRKSFIASATVENNSLHVRDNQKRVAIARVGGPLPGDNSPAIKYHFGDHLGSSNVVVDENGALFNREEYLAYGETSFGSFARKRYRFTGKERDAESGLYYHGARCYAPWLARWMSCDPEGEVDGVNLYVYSRSSPTGYVDPTGRESKNVNINMLSSGPATKAESVSVGTKGQGSLVVTNWGAGGGHHISQAAAYTKKGKPDSHFGKTMTISTKIDGLKQAEHQKYVTPAQKAINQNPAGLTEQEAFALEQTLIPTALFNKKPGEHSSRFPAGNTSSNAAAASRGNKYTFQIDVHPVRENPY